MGLKFDYWPRPTKSTMEHDPIIGVSFINPANNKSIDVDCLIDSGADDIVIHADFAQVLDIELEGGETREYQGIAHKPITGYVHKLKMKLRDDASLYVVRCAFVPNLPRAGLLGQNGFFDNYKILFERRKKRFEITPL